MVNTFVPGLGATVMVFSRAVIFVVAVTEAVQLTGVTSAEPVILMLSILASPPLPVACNLISVEPAFRFTTVDVVVQVVQSVVAGKEMAGTAVPPLISRLPGLSVPPPFEYRQLMV